MSNINKFCVHIHNASRHVQRSSKRVAVKLFVEDFLFTEGKLLQGNIFYHKELYREAWPEIIMQKRGFK